jgi:CheY-like chemotaxis protein
MEPCKWEKVAHKVIVLIVEDDEIVQSIAEDALKDGGFDTAIAASAEEAVNLLQSKIVDYRALVIDINLKGRMSGWGRQTGTETQPRISDRLHDWCRRRRLDVTRCSPQHSA